MSEEERAERVFVLGLDGVPWNLLSNWAEQGDLQNVARLFSEGTVGPLESTMPPTTPVAWPSIATGVSPDKHGLYAFHELESAYTRQVNTSSDCKRPTLWEMLSPSVVANVPMTYPAQEIDGSLVSGMMSPDMGEGFTTPPDLASRIKREIPDYQIGLNWSEYHDREEAFLEDLDSLLSARRQLMELLMDEEDWRLFFFVYTEPDRLQHLIWNEPTLLEHYRQLDEILGDVMAYAEKQNAALFVVSDHGFGPISTFVHLNSILRDEGYLTPKGGGTRGVLSRAGITKSRVMGSLDRLGIEDMLVDQLPQSVLDRVATQVPGSHGLYDVNFEATEAFAHGTRNIYINDTERFAKGTVEPERKDELKEELVALFESVVDPTTGETVLTVHDGSELFPTDERSPDLVLYGDDGYLTSTALKSDQFTDSGGMAGAHRSEGIFLSWGPTIRAGEVADANVVDVAPTILHAIGEPIPDDTDGTVLDIFTPESAPDREPVETQSYRATREGKTTHRDTSEVEDRLRGLGYIE